MPLSSARKKSNGRLKKRQFLTNIRNLFSLPMMVSSRTKRETDEIYDVRITHLTQFRYST